jgi:tetratricopeptide (TPR) repeat protein
LPLFLAGPNDRLQRVCDALFNFLDFTGRWDESLSLNQQAEAKAVAAGDLANAGWRAYDAGYVHHFRQQADAVLECADRAIAHWQTAQAGTRELSAAIRLRGIGHQLKKQYPDAIASYRESLHLLNSSSGEHMDMEMAIALNALANAERLSGDLRAAERDYREALRVAHVIGDVASVANITGNLAELALDRGDWSLAETLSRESLPLAERVGRMELVALNSRRLAEILVRQGKHVEAVSYARRSVEIYTRLGHPDLEAARETLKGIRD